MTEMQMASIYKAKEVHVIPIEQMYEKCSIPRETKIITEQEVYDAPIFCCCVNLKIGVGIIAVLDCFLAYHIWKMTHGENIILYRELIAIACVVSSICGLIGLFTKSKGLIDAFFAGYNVMTPYCIVLMLTGCCDIGLSSYGAGICLGLVFAVVLRFYFLNCIRVFRNNID